MKVVMIIAQKDFRDEELFDTKEVFENSGLYVDVAASEEKTASGMLGGSIEPDIKISEIEVSKYDAIVFIGGPGAYDFIDDNSIHELANNFYGQRKLVAAICIAPAILARAGLLKNIKATIHDSGVEYLQNAEAIYTGNDVEVGENIITANGPAVASLFGHQIVKYLKTK